MQKDKSLIMRKNFGLLLIVLLPVLAFSQPTERRAKYDISKERVLYAVGIPIWIQNMSGITSPP